MDFSGWVRQLESEGQDSYGAFEFPLGVTVIVGYLLLTLLGKAPWWAVFLYAVLGIVALGVGHQLEGKQHRDAGRRRARGTLLLRVTWIIAFWCLLWVLLLLFVASARGWTEIPGFHGGAVALGLILGLYALCFGLKNRLIRTTCTGAVLVLWSALVPAIGVLRDKAFLSYALLIGGTLLLSGFLGRRSWRAYLAIRRG